MVRNEADGEWQSMKHKSPEYSKFSCIGIFLIKSFCSSLLDLEEVVTISKSTKMMNLEKLSDIILAWLSRFSDIDLICEPLWRFFMNNK